jgi:hypothetical protein
MVVACRQQAETQKREGETMSSTRDRPAGPAPAESALVWGTVWTSATLLTVLVMLINYQAVHVRRCPPSPLPAPGHRRTGEPQHPNGELITQPT